MKICECGHKAIFIRRAHKFGNRVKVGANKQHHLCVRCFQSLRDSLRYMSRLTRDRPYEPKGFDYVFKGGRYAGMSVQQLVEHNPGYILWLQEHTDLDFHHEVIELCEERPIQT